MDYRSVAVTAVIGPQLPVAWDISQFTKDKSSPGSARFPAQSWPIPNKNRLCHFYLRGVLTRDSRDRVQALG
jgi:hypothetical protein